MSTIFSSSTNVSLFQVEGDIQLPNAENLFQWLSERLGQFCFHDISENQQETSIGWVQVDDHTKTGFTSPAYLWIDRYIFLRLRKDTRKVPSAVMKQEIAACTEEWLKDKPNFRRPPKQVREEIADKVKLDLLKKTLPVPKIVDAIWDIEKRSFMLLSASNADIELFETLFARTFEGMRLVAMVPFALAASSVATDKNLFTQLADANRSTTDSLLDMITANTWLGNEFAAWMLAGCGSAGGSSGYVSGKISLVGENQKAVFSGSVDENLVAIKKCFQERKAISEVRLLISKEDGSEWSLTLDTAMFRLKSIKHPVTSLADAYSGTEDHMQADMLMRVWSLQTVMGLLWGTLLPEFVKAKFDGSFAAELESFVADV